MIVLFAQLTVRILCYSSNWTICNFSNFPDYFYMFEVGILVLRIVSGLVIVYILLLSV